MKKIYLIFGLVFGLQTLATAQLTCGDTFTDSGGAAGEYQNDELDTITICAVSPTDVATITFSSFDLEEDYDFMYIIDGDLVTGTLVGTYTGANNPGTITSENIGGCMTIIFQSDESVTTAGWEAVIGCVAGPTCLRPSGITGSTTENSATLSWTANSGETSWGVEYGPAGFTQGTGTWMLTSSNPLTISGLTDLTSYDLYIYAKCSGVDSSTTLGPIAFSTNALPLTCGDMFYDTGVDTASYNADQNYIQVICPTTPGEVVVLTFSSFDTENNYDSLVIFNGNTTTDPILGIYQGTNSPGTIYSTNPNGCLTAWFSSDNIVQNDGWAATVTCQAPITCFTPTAVAVDTNTYDSGTISWTSAGAETMWAVEYGPAGFAQGSGTMEVASTNPYVITGLTELTDYDVYVRAICGAGDTSFYSGLASFTTGLAPLAPFICGNLFTDNGGVSTDYSANSNDTIVICPVNAGDVVVLSFTEFDTENGYDSLTVYNGNSVASPLLGIYQGTTSPGTIYSTDATGCLTAVFTSDDIVQNPGWSATISCQAPPTCAVPTALTVDANTDITATVSWTNGATETSWAIEYGAAGFAQGSGTSVIASTNPFTLTGLTGNTDYDVYVRAICGAGDTSFYSSSTSFTTDISATILPQLTCGEMFYDTGMDAADYSDDEYTVQVICPTTSGEMITLTFSDFATEDGWDSLSIYNGNTSSDPLIGIYQGSTSPGVIVSTNANGCLTAVFRSDGSTTDLGWAATITCDVPVVPCATPTNLVATSVTSNSATLGWTNGGTETAWIVEYGVTGFTQGTGTMLPATTNPTTVAGLTVNTSYQFYVIAVCSPTDSSSVSTAGSFTTLNNVGISENEINALSIAPNPSTGKFVIKNTSGFQIEGQLFDAQGRALDLKVNTIDANKEVVLDLNNFVDGVYFFKTSSSNGTKTYSLVKN